MRYGVLLASLLVACSQRVATGDELPDHVEEVDAPAAIAKAICTPHYECDCASTSHEDVDACIADRTANYEAAALAAIEDGLAYDGECVAALVAWHAEIGCALQSSFEFPEPERPRCHPYSLRNAESMIECTLPAAFGSIFATPCKGGESCIDGQCTPPWWEVGAEIGERCPAPQGCRYPGACVDDECVPRTAAGGPCGEIVLAPCDEASYCDGSVCVTKRGPGAACEGNGYDASCINLACEDGVCSDVPLQCIGA